MDVDGGRNDFPVVRRGYDPTEVDRYVAGLQSQLTELRQQQQGPAGAEEVDAPPRSIEELGERVGQILQLAWESAEELRARAAAEAEQRLNEAALATRTAEERTGSLLRRAEARMADTKAEADRITDEARKAAAATVATAEHDARARADETVVSARAQAERTLSESKAAADRLVADARAQAERSLADARSGAERSLVEARVEAERMLTESRRARDAAETELAGLHEARQRVAADLAAALAALEEAVSGRPGPPGRESGSRAAGHRSAAAPEATA